MTWFFMDGFEPRINPRFLAESEKGMLSRIREGNSRRFQEDEKLMVYRVVNYI